MPVLTRVITFIAVVLGRPGLTGGPDIFPGGRCGPAYTYREGYVSHVRGGEALDCHTPKPEPVKSSTTSTFCEASSEPLHLGRPVTHDY